MKNVWRIVNDDLKGGRPVLLLSSFVIRHSSLARRRKIISILSVALVSLGFASGCIQMASAWTNITGGDWIAPEFELTKEPLLVLVDDRGGQISEPKAIREVHQTISEIF